MVWDSSCPPQDITCLSKVASPDSLSHMEWAAVIVAVLAALFAGWQAFEARKARIEARAAQGAAEDAATTAASAQTQSAESLAAIAAIVTEQHQAARVAAAKKPNPWQILPGRYVKTGHTRKLTLVGEENIIDVELKFERKPGMLNLDPSPVPIVWRPGDAVELYWVSYGSDSSSFVLEVQWRREGDPHRTVTRTTLP